MTISNTPPCLTCVDRYVGCHTSCKKYSLFKLRLKNIKNERNKDLVIKQYKGENIRTKFSNS